MFDQTRNSSILVHVRPGSKKGQPNNKSLPVIQPKEDQVPLGYFHLFDYRLLFFFLPELPLLLLRIGAGPVNDIQSI